MAIAAVRLGEIPWENRSRDAAYALRFYDIADEDSLIQIVMNNDGKILKLLFGRLMGSGIDRKDLFQDLEKKSQFMTMTEIMKFLK